MKGISRLRLKQFGSKKKIWMRLVETLRLGFCVCCDVRRAAVTLQLKQFFREKFCVKMRQTENERVRARLYLSYKVRVRPEDAMCVCVRVCVLCVCVCCVSVCVCVFVCVCVWM